jgi:hypothetical protein
LRRFEKTAKKRPAKSSDMGGHDGMTSVFEPSLRLASPWWQPRPEGCLLIEGGRPLIGAYSISGAKNAVLPLMVAALVTPHLVTLHNVPASLDVAVLSSLLQRLGAGLSWSQGSAGLSLTLCADRIRTRAAAARTSLAVTRAPLRRGTPRMDLRPHLAQLVHMLEALPSRPRL